jgi:hypothetical protein
MIFRNPVREEFPPRVDRVMNDTTSTAPWRRSGSQGTGPIQSLTTKRGGQSRRRPSRWACNKASVQSWKKWLRSLNPKSRTMRSRVSKCSRRTLVVRLPCMIWVNSGSVFILAIQQRGFNDSTAFRFRATTDTGSHLDSLRNGALNCSALDAWINTSLRKESIGLPARISANDATVTFASLWSIPNILA